MVFDATTLLACSTKNAAITLKAMANIWNETTKQARSMPLGWSGLRDFQRSPHDFRPFTTWYVRVCSFTFRFTNIQQLETCLEFFKQKTRASSRIPYRDLKPYVDAGLRGWEVQRWFDRLPMYLLEEPKRQKVVAALALANKRWLASLS
ncbi:hypothetical protein RBB79_05885 [Tunturiibacter empetritectus]|uniref:Uncharacterized protein n=2 Tax=Tunturiibacter TaxID=3154218 RepID=A0A852VC66_9BACT|nr:hypothetical protein [Edaphobacter lichenicola]NYF89057.1 hypothetical protein [Edaphobacter lichenicola]